MNMQSIMHLKEMLCEELDEIAQRGELSSGQLDTVEKLTTSVKNLCKIIMCEEGDEGYSRDGNWSARGTYSRGRMSRYDVEPGRERADYSYRRY